MKNLWVGLYPESGSAIIARYHRVVPQKSPKDDGAPGAGAPFTRRLPGRPPPAELLHCRRSGFTNLFFLARTDALRRSPFLDEAKMEPEHEIFFMGWRAHGLRAMECTGVSVLHHGWAHRGTAERDAYNVATLRKVKYPEALCRAYPCLKRLSSVHHSFDCSLRKACKGHRNAADRLWDVSRSCVPFPWAELEAPLSRAEPLDATDPHAETETRACAAASPAAAEYGGVPFVKPARWLPLPPLRDAQSIAEAEEAAAEADTELQEARAAASQRAGVRGGGSPHRRQRERRSSRSRSGWRAGGLSASPQPRSSGALQPGRGEGGSGAARADDDEPTEELAGELGEAERMREELLSQDEWEGEQEEPRDDGDEEGGGDIVAR